MQLVWSEEDLSPREEPVTLGKQEFVIKEASEDVHRQYKNFMVAGAKVEEGRMTMGKVADADLYLLGACLYEVTDEKTNGTVLAHKVHRPANSAFVRLLPHRIADPLVERIKKISGIGQEKPKQEKLEETFRKTAADLFSLSENEMDRCAWKTWMAEAITAAGEETANHGPEEVALKN